MLIRNLVFLNFIPHELQWISGENSSAQYDENIHKFEAVAKTKAQVRQVNVGEGLEGRGSPKKTQTF